MVSSVETKNKFRLSPEQKIVVDHRGSPLQVIACAGSGKTESISCRVAALIDEGNPPESIVAFTFTEKAVSELKERINKRVEELKGNDFLGRLGPMFVGTIHAYCFRILQDHVPHYGNYDVLQRLVEHIVGTQGKKSFHMDTSTLVVEVDPKFNCAEIHCLMMNLHGSMRCWLIQTLKG